MKFLAKALIFMMCFCLEIQTKASSNHKVVDHSKVENSEVNDSKSEYTEGDHSNSEHLGSDHSKYDGYTQVPEGCLGLTNECAFKRKGNSAGDYLMENADIHFSKNALLVRVSPTEVRLVKGKAAVRAIGSLVFDTRYGQISLNPGDMVFVDLQFDKTVLSTLKGEAIVTLKGSRELVKLPQAYEFWFGGVQRTGQPLTGRIRPTLLSKLIEEWGKIEGDKAFVRETLVSLYDDWKIAVMLSGSRDLATVHELRAEDHERKRVLALRRKKLESENKELRKIFYDRTFR